MKTYRLNFGNYLSIGIAVLVLLCSSFLMISCTKESSAPTAGVEATVDLSDEAVEKAKARIADAEAQQEEAARKAEEAAKAKAEAETAAKAEAELQAKAEAEAAAKAEEEARLAAEAEAAAAAEAEAVAQHYYEEPISYYDGAGQSGDGCVDGGVALR